MGHNEKPIAWMKTAKANYNTWSDRESIEINVQAMRVMILRVFSVAKSITLNFQVDCVIPTNPFYGTNFNFYGADKESVIENTATTLNVTEGRYVVLSIRVGYEGIE